MGEITVNVTLENPIDRGVFERGEGEEAAIRRSSIDAIVDTGAVMLVLPQNVVERLGLETRRTVIVSYADERKEERPVAGPLTIRIGNRFMSTDCVVGPPLSEPLIGQIVLEALDLIADCTNRTLTPRPESPDYPLLKLKRQSRSRWAVMPEVARFHGIVKPMNPPRILSATAVNDRTLVVEFDNKQKKQFDITPLLKRTLFSPLKNSALFKAVKVEPGGYAVAWSNSIDISEYELWRNGKDLP